MQISRCLLFMCLCTFLNVSKAQKGDLSNTSWVEKTKDCSDYIYCSTELYFYSNGRYLERNILMNGTVSTLYKGNWKITSDSLRLIPDTVLSYSRNSNIYFRETLQSMLPKESFRINFKYCFFKPRFFLYQEGETFKVKRKFKLKNINNNSELKFQIIDVEHINTTQ